MSLDSAFWMEQFGEHADVKKYMMGQKQLHFTDIEKFIEEIEQAELLIRTSWETLSQYDMSAFQIPVVKRVMDIDANLAICKAVLGEVNPCESWMDAKCREHILLEIEDCEQCCLQIKRITYQLMEVHNDQIFRINYEEFIPRFTEDYQGFFKRMKGSYKQDREQILMTYKNVPDNLTDEEIVRVLKTLQMLGMQRESFRQRKAFLIENIGTYYHGENTNWGLLKADIKQFEEIISYFDTPQEAYESITVAKESFAILNQYYTSLMTLRNAVREKAAVFYTGGEFEMTEIGEIAADFTQMIEKARNMQRDFRNIATYRKTMENLEDLSYQEILHSVQSLDKFNRDKIWIEEKERELKDVFGEEFKGRETDWDSIKERLNEMKSMYVSFDAGMYGDKLTEFFQDDARTFSKEELSVQDYKAMLSKIESELKSFLQVDSLNKLTLDKAVEQLAKAKNMCMDMDDIFTQVSKLRKRREHAKNMLEDMRQFARMQSIEHKFSEDDEVQLQNYGALYQGVVTDWNAIGDKVQLAKSMRSDVSRYHVSRTMLEAILDSEVSQLDVYGDLNILTGASIYQKEFDYIASLFRPEAYLEEMEFESVHRKLANCYQSMEQLGSWIIYQQGRTKCVKHGLMSFIDAVEGKQLESDKIRHSFIETFYTKWMESILYEKGGLHPYRVKSYEEIVEIQRIEEEKIDIRAMEAADYLRYVPCWLSRRKTCLLVREESLPTGFYKKIVLESEK